MTLVSTRYFSALFDNGGVARNYFRHCIVVKIQDGLHQGWGRLQLMITITIMITCHFYLSITIMIMIISHYNYPLRL